jgi:TetR/AcrR family transcriptional regulator, repressor of fatR-cypB operon
MNVHSHREGVPRSTRDAILDAALALFCDRGFHGTAVPAVAGAAGIATGTIYRHFTSKEALVNELFRRCKVQMMTALLDRFPFEASPRQQFHVFWQRLARFAREHARAFTFLELHHHAPYLDADNRARELDALGPIVAFFERTGAAGVTRPLPPPALIAVVWGALVGLVKAASLGHLELTDDLIQQVEQSCWDSIARPRPTTNEGA